jgi:hypothetical protein
MAFMMKSKSKLNSGNAYYSVQNLPSSHLISKNLYSVLVGRPRGKRPLGRPRCRGEDNIKLDLRAIGIDGVNWIQLAQDRVQWQAIVSTVMTFGSHKENRIFLIS